jgi:hypothetical protein
MTVQELIDELMNLDPDAKVILQKDAEGNGYSPLVGAEECLYMPETSYSGEVIPPADLQTGYYDERDLESAVVLWPTN